MATTSSAKAGRKEALRSAACRSGAALSAPAAAAGPRLGGEGGGQQVVPVLLAAAALHGKSRFVQARGLHSRRPATATARPHRHNITRKVCISGGRTGTGHGSNNSRCVDSGDTAAILPRNTRSGLRRVASMDTALWQYRIQSPELCRAQGCCGAHIAVVTVAGAGAGGACWRFAAPHCGLRLAAASRLAAWPGPRPEPQAAPAPGWEDVGPVVHPAVSSPGTVGTVVQTVQPRLASWRGPHGDKVGGAADW